MLIKHLRAFYFINQSLVRVSLEDYLDSAHQINLFIFLILQYLVGLKDKSNLV